MNYKFPPVTWKSLLCSLTIIVVLFLEYYVNKEFFPQFVNSFTPTILLALAGFICGLIYGETLKNSIIHLMILIEILMILLWSIMFAFNPWGNTTHIPPTLSNIFVLPITIIISSLLGSLVLLIFTSVFFAFGSWGMNINKKAFINLNNHKFGILKSN
jgi:hypothetical protein